MALARIRGSDEGTARQGTNTGTAQKTAQNGTLSMTQPTALTRRVLREDEPNGGSVFPAHANTGDPNDAREA